MSVTVFTWNMFSLGRFNGVGHASMHVMSPHRHIYISFWPSQHSLSAATWSTGKIHFMSGDKAEDGTPSWASKPLVDLDEDRIIDFWKRFDPNSELDYQGAASRNVTKPNEGGRRYNILFNQCSSVVLLALLVGASSEARIKIARWLAINAGTNVDFAGGAVKFAGGLRLPTVTPADIRELVKDVWVDF